MSLTKSCYPIGVSLPKEIVKKIDLRRLDIPRSRYILRLIEHGLNDDKINTENGVLTK